MAIIIILIAYYFDYKSSPKTFWSDFKGGLSIVIFFLFYGLALKTFFDIGILYIVFSAGIELFLLFCLKGLLKK